MIRISAFTLSKNNAAARFRIRQYIEALNKRGVYVTENYPVLPYDYRLPGFLGTIRPKYLAPIYFLIFLIRLFSRLPSLLKARNADIIWLSRTLGEKFLIEKFFHKPLILDVDDAIWLNNEQRYIRLAKKASMIFAGNRYIAQWFQQYNDNVQIIPTSINSERYKPDVNKEDKDFRIVWSGSNKTEFYLKTIEHQLASFFEKYKDSKLIIVSNSIPDLPLINRSQLIFKPWNPEDEVKAIQSAHIGIMPLLDDEWVKGKCSFKMLQYMSCGLPVIVSNVGMNKEVLGKGNIGYGVNQSDEWFKYFQILYHDNNKRKLMGERGLSVINKYYSLNVVLELIAKSFEEIVE